MKKPVLKIISIIAAFILGILGMSYYLTAGNTDSTAVMEEATLPLIYMEQDGKDFNLLHGYTRTMDAGTIRDSLTALPADRTAAFRIEYPDAKVQKVYYELRSLDMTRLIEDGEITDLERGSRVLQANLQLKDLMDEGEEYLLVIRIPGTDTAECKSRTAFRKTHPSEGRKRIPRPYPPSLPA